MHYFSPICSDAFIELNAFPIRTLLWQWRLCRLEERLSSAFGKAAQAPLEKVVE
jgi:hypothetical protein